MRLTSQSKSARLGRDHLCRVDGSRPATEPLTSAVGRAWPIALHQLSVRFLGNGHTQRPGPPPEPDELFPEQPVRQWVQSVVYA